MRKKRLYKKKPDDTERKEERKRQKRQTAYGGEIMKKWEANIRKVVPYVPGEQPKAENIIKLNTNENPYPPAPGVQKLAAQMDTDRMRLYPDPTNGALVDVLAQTYGLPSDQVFVGVGSDDVLAMCFLTFFNSEKPILFPDITYSFYDVWADLYRIPYRCQPLDENLCIRREDYYQENGGIIFPNPNAPTGIYEPLEMIEDVLQHNPDVIVIIDEAYIDFADGPSARSLLEKYENLLVVQTFSKSRSMAGMRIGYAMGSRELIRALNDVKYSFNSYTMNQAALELGTEAVRDQAYFEACVEKIKATREWSKTELKKLGFSFPDSQSNFIFATHDRADARVIFQALKERGIFVRYFSKPRVDAYLRITIGTDEQMVKLMEALKEILSHECKNAVK